MLYLGDCLEVMKSLDDKSIDMVLADLPYGTTACKWDEIIPMEPLWEEYNRVTKDNAPMVFFSSQPFTAAFIVSNLENFKYEWIWVKNRPGNINCGPIRPMKYHENIIVFSKGKETYYPQKVSRHPNGTKRVVHGKAKNEIREITFGEHNSKKVTFKQEYSKIDKDLVNPKSTLYFSRINNTVHPTQKPIDLLEYLIKTYSSEGDTVLDNVMGSGSTGVACKRLNRKFIGIEKEPKYFEIAEKRINEVLI